MNKLNEIFVESINKAYTAAGVMTDINQKPIAFAAIAQAIATYLKNEHKENAITEISNNQVNEALNELQKDNEKVATKINETVKEIEKNIAKEEKVDEWQLSYDENGIPYLNQEDFKDPNKVLSYQKAMTPELKAKKKAIDQAKGQVVLNEDTNTTTQQQQVNQHQQPTETNQISFEQDDLNTLEEYKNSFAYGQDTSVLDGLFYNCTSGAYKSVQEITPVTIKPFLLFLKEQLNNAWNTLENWKTSWITEEGLNSLLAQAYGVEGATVQTHVSNYNIFWFLQYIELYSANVWLNNYKNNMDKTSLDACAKRFLDNDQNATIDNIDDTNVVGFVYFMQNEQ